MGYLKEFQSQIANRDFTKFMQLWEEYCTCDKTDVDELVTVLQMVKSSDFAKPFGQFVETTLPLVDTIPSEDAAYAVLRLLYDLQSTNTPKLAQLALDILKKRHGNEADFQEKLRLIGLRNKENFQAALSNFDLLSHIKKGNFVYHGGGWGVGEIMDHSSVREQIVIEFENVAGIKHITFSNAFKTLVPLPSTHFLARRFAHPDQFEKEAKENPIEAIKCLLRDLGPKTAADIKDELCELVIPEKEWQKWWQNARAKIKKDTEIESPENPRDPFILRKEAVSHESQFLETLKKKKTDNDLLLACYNFIRDHAGKIKQTDVKNALQENLKGILSKSDVSPAMALQTYFCLDAIQETKHETEIKKILKSADSLEDLFNSIEIVAHKKQALMTLKGSHEDWPKLFLQLLHSISQGQLRDYIFKELNISEYRPLLEKGLISLVEEPWKDPEFFLWYFNKTIEEGDKELPYGDKAGQEQLTEAFLVLLNRIENDPDYKELIKKMYITLSNKRYALVRKIFEGCSIGFVREFLLLASKCHTLNDHDLKILRSLAEVVHPALVENKSKETARHDANTIWTTEAGYLKTQERIKHIGTKEVVENAREIEAARALGDLRENSEYKSALEKRARLQGELKSLSEQLSKARIISPQDVLADEAWVGSIVHVVDSTGKKATFTILGPWEADPEASVLSFQSKLAQSIIGLHVNDKFKFKDEEYTIQNFKTIFDK